MSTNQREQAEQAFYALSTALSHVPCRDRKQHEAMADVQEGVDALLERFKEVFPVPRSYPDR